MTETPRRMTEALRLTRAGRLDDATRLLLGASVSPREPRRARPAQSIDERSFPKASRPARGGWNAGGAASLKRRGTQASSDAAQPKGAIFSTLQHSGSSGRLAYKLYIPSSLQEHLTRSDGALPLLVMLHGCGQDPDDFAAGTRMNELAEEAGLLVIYPAQDRSANGQGCWNWFRPQDQRRDSGEPALIAGVVRDVIGAHPIDPDRVYVAGMSAGGAAAAVLAQTYPDLFAAAGVHSGIPTGAAHDLPSALSAMSRGASAATGPITVPMIVFHGDADRIVSAANGAALARQATASARLLATSVEYGASPGGVSYTREIHSEVAGSTTRIVCEHWTLRGGGHAWSGGDPAGSHTDARGPDASREMVRFFGEQRRSSPPSRES